jgi:hypothetical protein
MPGPWQGRVASEKALKVIRGSRPPASPASSPTTRQAEWRRRRSDRRLLTVI